MTAASATGSTARFTDAGRHLRHAATPRRASVWPRSRKARAADVDAAVAAARAGPSRNGRGCRAISARRHLYALARLVQKHARLLAVLETMDNGKPIRESRDIDIPLVARHFYYHAGLAQLLASRTARTWRPLGVCGAVIPWNFPLLMLAWKVAPALAAGQHRRPEARRIHAADRASVRRTQRARRACRRAC